MGRRKHKIDKTLRKILPNRIADSIGQRILQSKNLYYGKMKFSDEDLEAGSYKNYFGGKSDQWELRGAFQLYFLKIMGLKPSHKLLDIGCGPARAGLHFIDYLEPLNYTGVDYNPDFIEIASRLTSDKSLTVKKPNFGVVKDFKLSVTNGLNDYAIAFSVLNHCSERDKELFFSGIKSVLSPEGRLFITHAEWFDESYIEKTDLKHSNTIHHEEEIEIGFDWRNWGWTKEANPFPIIELVSR